MMVSCWNTVDHCEYLELHLTACPCFCASCTFLQVGSKLSSLEEGITLSSSFPYLIFVTGATGIPV